MSAQDMAALEQWAKEAQEATDKVLAKHPDLNPITASVMGQDFAQAERAFAKVEAGEWDVDRALTLTGSFARLDLADRLYAAGYLPLAEYHQRLPELWRGSDPDDTDPRWLRLWRLAWMRNKRRIIRDGGPLPRRRPLIVYRGQPENATLGIAWTTDQAIAEKFAKGAGARVPTPDGVIYKAYVNPQMVLAYLTERGESEVIVDPAYLIPMED